MKRFFLCFLLSSFILPVIAQEDYIDQLVEKGTELREMGCFENAIRSYQDGLNISPESMILYFEMACSYASMNEMEKSIECAEKAMWSDDRSQELMYLWIFILSASEIINQEAVDPEGSGIRLPTVKGRQIDQIH